MLKIFTGPMFSGKTTALISEAVKYSKAGKKVIVFSPEIDTRHPASEVKTHTGATFEAVKISSIFDIWKYIDQQDLICFDEIQFFPEDLADLCDLLNYKGMNVVCSGLDLDFKGVPFDTTSILMSYADLVVKLGGICECGAIATRSHLKNKLSNSRVQIGDQEYAPVCAQCFYKLNDFEF